jgi:hypothetical protein
VNSIIPIVELANIEKQLSIRMKVLDNHSSMLRGSISDSFQDHSSSSLSSSSLSSSTSSSSLSSSSSSSSSAAVAAHTVHNLKSYFDALNHAVQQRTVPVSLLADPNVKFSSDEAVPSVHSGETVRLSQMDVDSISASFDLKPSDSSSVDAFEDYRTFVQSFHDTVFARNAQTKFATIELKPVNSQHIPTSFASLYPGVNAKLTEFFKIGQLNLQVAGGGAPLDVILWVQGIGKPFGSSGGILSADGALALVRQAVSEARAESAKFCTGKTDFLVKPSFFSTTSSAARATTGSSESSSTLSAVSFPTMSSADSKAQPGPSISQSSSQIKNDFSDIDVDSKSAILFLKMLDNLEKTLQRDVQGRASDHCQEILSMFGQVDSALDVLSKIRHCGLHEIMRLKSIAQSIEPPTELSLGHFKFDPYEIRAISTVSDWLNETAIDRFLSASCHDSHSLVYVTSSLHEDFNRIEIETIFI